MRRAEEVRAPDVVTNRCFTCRRERWEVSLPELRIAYGMTAEADKVLDDKQTQWESSEEIFTRVAQYWSWGSLPPDLARPSQAMESSTLLVLLVSKSQL
jgi:hypothetical protein